MAVSLLRPLIFTAAGLVCLTVVSRAQDASEWQSEAHGAARLIAGAMVKTPTAAFLRAGIEIRLDPGWKTYWRYPGDSGVPPTFDFAGSQNVKSAIVEWPAPEEFPDGAGGHSIGYVGDVVLPVKVTPIDASRGTSLQLTLNYAMCGTLCLPAQAKLELPLTGKAADPTMLEKAEQRVPKRAALGVDPGNGLMVRSVQLAAAGGRERIVIDLAAPAGAPLDLFVEGPTSEWALPLPEPDGTVTGDNRRYSLDVDGLPPGAHIHGATLTITAVSGDTAIEVPAHID
ncbi:MAG TPA: protein-disulfide reductase DsbD domain-containing protein [Xanthobacteraceae bacterium]|nr:protein-disulfide reductase DsbD domain-containing protein [Xanthobacteraceae bacterium]